MIESNPIDDFYERDREMMIVGTKVNTIVRGRMKRYLDRKGFLEINPVIISPISDPLNHPVDDPTLSYYGHKYRLTKSMIFHKQLALVHFDKIYSFSPNIRIEPIERKSTGRHLAEFTQLDLEVKGVTREYVIDLAEGMINDSIVCVKRSIDPEKLNPYLKKYEKPFKKVRYQDAVREFGKNFEATMSADAKEPFWIIDIPLQEREFYDREKDEEEGVLMDMDLIYPHGYGEAISGGEREHEYERILKRIAKKGQRTEDFALLLKAARKGLPPSAGFGIGIERFVRFLTGSEDISRVVLFPKKIGEYVL
ncbi:MAG: asparagine synthetase A [Thermoplasmatales archaeon]|nr:asparagine synthetase A [Thermoplasmatales archaeon]